MFDLQLLDYDPNTPSFYVILVTALFAFFLSAIIAITYEYTTKSIHKKAHFVQGIILIGIVAATIMQAIGDSVARGLGMLGALSIIRFRTELNDPRNITFMFASLAVGISCGVFGYGIALTGTLVFCLAAIILRFSPLSDTNELIGDLRIQLPKENNLQEAIEYKIKDHCVHFQLERWQVLSPAKSTASETPAPITVTPKEALQEYRYSVRLSRSSTASGLIDSLNEVENLHNIRLNFQNRPTKL